MRRICNAVRLASLLSILLCVAAAAPLSPPREQPKLRGAHIDAAMLAARKFLAEQQAVDGAWRSDVYSPFRGGDALTPLVLTSLLASDKPLPLDGTVGGNTAVDRATAYLLDFVQPNGRLAPPTGGFAYSIYTAADSVIALSELARRKSTNESLNDTLSKARNAWLAYLLERQLTEPLGWTPSDAQYGGWGYAGMLPHKPNQGETLASLAEPNLSATVYALTAVRAAGLQADHPAVKNGLAFARRLQDFLEIKDDTAPEPTVDDRGGFHFILNDAVRNKAGVAPSMDDRTVRFRSYGSATADGLRALLLAGEPSDSPRSRAAWIWLEHHFSATSHPGDYAKDREAARDSFYFYYCRSLTAALNLAGPVSLPHEAHPRDWAESIAEALIVRQRSDGSWSNLAVDGREDDPIVATSFALEALANCRRYLRTVSAQP